MLLARIREATYRQRILSIFREHVLEAALWSVGNGIVGITNSTTLALVIERLGKQKLSPNPKVYSALLMRRRQEKECYEASSGAEVNRSFGLRFWLHTAVDAA